MSVVETAIAQRCLTLDFVHSWGKVQEAAGHLHALLTPGGAVEKNFWKGLKAAKASDTTLQRYWYAHWMVAHGYLEEVEARRVREDELAELCGDIDQNRCRPILYNKAWFNCLIEYPDKEIKEESKQASLKTTYTRLPKAEIQRMSANSLIPRSALPPLTIDAFTPLSDDVP